MVDGGYRRLAWKGRIALFLFWKKGAFGHEGASDADLEGGTACLFFCEDGTAGRVYNHAGRERGESIQLAEEPLILARGVGVCVTEYALSGTLDCCTGIVIHYRTFCWE